MTLVCAGLNWTVVTVAIHARFRITAIVSAHVCITIEIVIVLSVGTWVRLPITMEGIGIFVCCKLVCLNDGTCVPL
jgi:hypothetical protein